MCGLATGNGVHAIAAAVGLSAVLAASALAFSAVKYAGAAYLYLGVRRLMQRDEPVEVEVEAVPLRRVYVRGLMVGALNPKTAAFFLAFLPQFVGATSGSVPLQLLVLGLSFAGLGMITDGAHALVSGTASGWLKHRKGFLREQRYISGGTYLTLGVATAVTGSSND